MLTITLLGTSALIPLPDRALTAAVLSCNGRTLLIDCGEGTQTAARKAGVSLMKTDLVALTHFHGDHIFGLPGLLQTMCSMGRTDPLWITGPRGLHSTLEPLLKLVGWVTYDIHLLELPKEGLPLSTLHPAWPATAKLTAFPTQHRVPSQGYVFTLDRVGKFDPELARNLNIPMQLWGKLQKGQTVEADGIVYHPEQVLGQPRKGLKFVMTGDTCFCDSLIEASRNADLLISEATYGENEQEALALDHGHMNFAQAATVAARAEVQRLWLTHYSQMIEEPEEYLPNAAAIFPETVCGTDGMQLTLRFPER